MRQSSTPLYLEVQFFACREQTVIQEHGDVGLYFYHDEVSGLFQDHNKS